MKKTVISILIIIVLGGTGAYLYLKKQEIPDYNMVNMVSPDAAFFLNIQNARKFLEKLSEKNAIWNELTQIPSIKATDHQIEVLDSVIRSDNVLKKFFRNRRLIISAEKQGKERIDFTFLVKLDHLREQRHIWQHLQRWGNQENHRLTSKKYNKVRLSTLHRNEEQYLSFAVMKGILIVSTSPLLVEQAIRQTSVKSTITDDNHFQKVAQTAGKNVTANLYIHLKKFPEVISLPLKQPFESYIKNISKFARWSALDVNFKSEALLLNGFTVQDKEQIELIDLFRQQEPVDLEIENILPSNTAAYITLGISDKANYRKELMELYRENDVLHDYSAWIEHIENKHGFNPEEVFYSLLHQEVGMAFLNANTKDPKDKAFVIVKTRGQKYARSQLSEIMRDQSSSSSDAPHIQNITIDEGTSYPLYKLPIENLFSKLFGSLFHGLSNQYFTFIDKYAVFTGNPDLLKEFIYSNILNKTLKNNHLYQDFSDYLSGRSNFHFYANMYRSPHLISSFLRKDLQEGLQDNRDHLGKFQGLAFQFLNS